MLTLQKLVTLVIAHGLFAGCAMEARPQSSGLLQDDSILVNGYVLGDEASADMPSARWWEGHEAVATDAIEQWLRIEDLQTGEPVEGLCLCEATYHAGEAVPCAETDSEGQLLTHWTPIEQTYRMLGTSHHGHKFVLQDVADSSRVNRLVRPIRVLSRSELEGYYGRAMTPLNPEHHTVLARAQVGTAVADAVRFELHPVDAYETRVRLATYPDANGALAGGLEVSSSLGQGVFLDVAPGVYELRAERHGQPCTSAEVWLDGLIDQFIAPELSCG
jgi:hypothetical protein